MDAIARVRLDGTEADEHYIDLPPGDFDGLGPADGLTADGQYLYFASCGSNAIGRVRLGGTDLDKYFVATGECVQDVTVNSSHVYWPLLGLGEDDARGSGRAGIDGSAVEQDW